MIGNENRNNGFTGKDGGIVETDVIDNKKLTSGKCQMSCGHFTGYYLLIHIFKKCKSLYVNTQDKLQLGRVFKLNIVFVLFLIKVFRFHTLAVT